MGNRIFEEGPLKPHLQSICNEALNLTDADLVIIYPVQPKPNLVSEEITNYGAGHYSVAAGQLSDKTLNALTRHSQDGITHYVLANMRLVAADIEKFTDSQFCGLPLAKHPLIQDEKLKGLISVSLYDHYVKSSFGVLHLGYRNVPDDVAHEKEQADFIKRVVRRAVRADWRRKYEMALRDEEATVHTELMALSLEPAATVEDIAKLAAEKMRELLGKQRVDQESTVTLLQWKPATETEPALRYRVDYQIKTPDFGRDHIDRLSS